MALCTYGDCMNDPAAGIHAVVVTRIANHSGGRTTARFCCQAHAALWLLRHARNTHGEPKHELENL